MKRSLIFVAWGVFAVALTGCNSGWPRLFGCNSCQQEVYEECDPCATGYAPSSMSGAWIVQPGTTMDTLPGPVVSKPTAG